MQMTEHKKQAERRKRGEPGSKEAEVFLLQEAMEERNQRNVSNITNIVCVTEAYWQGGGILTLVVICGGTSSCMSIKPRKLYRAVAEQGGVSSTRKALLTPSTKSREVSGELHEGRATSY